MSAAGAPFVIVVGNEKGGAGKSTLAMHLIAALSADRAVGCIDLDLRQATLTRFLDNRRAWAAAKGGAAPMPACEQLTASGARHLDAAATEETLAFNAALQRLGGQCDAIVIDAPGADTHLSRLAHGAADLIVTPMNDSFVDFDVLGELDPATMELRRPSAYAERVWESRKRRAAAGGRIDWVVVRNRMSAAGMASRNGRRVGEALADLAARAGFRAAPGLSERVIYRELFPRGLTLLDFEEIASDGAVSLGHVAARQELRALIAALKLPLAPSASRGR